MDMFNKGVIKWAGGSIFLSRPFKVLKPNSEHGHLVVELSTLNKSVVVLTFKMVSVSQVRLHLHPGAWLASLDLEVAYWQVPILPRLRRSWRFRRGL